MNRDQLKKLEKDLWSAADKLRANSDLKASEYSTPVLGLIFLKFADNKYRQHEAAIRQEYDKLKGTRREKSLEEIAIEKCGFFLQDHARYDYLLKLPEKENIAKATGGEDAVVPWRYSHITDRYRDRDRICPGFARPYRRWLFCLSTKR